MSSCPQRWPRGSTADNAVWVLPRSHRWGHLDIPQIIAQHGERVRRARRDLPRPQVPLELNARRGRRHHVLDARAQLVVRRLAPGPEAPVVADAERVVRARRDAAGAHTAAFVETIEFGADRAAGADLARTWWRSGEGRARTWYATMPAPVWCLAALKAYPPLLREVAP